jgi:hypothetical protein
VKDGADGFLLVVRPMNVAGFEAFNKDVDHNNVHRMTYFEIAYCNIKDAHGPYHCKGNTLLGRVSKKIANIGHNVTKLFTQTCPVCIQREQRNKPVMGIKPIVTRGFGTCGQVDLIDFQSMPDGGFKYLLNYIDHGIKYLFSIPLQRKQGSCIAVALIKIITVIGPPMILQSDNGCEFNKAAMANAQNWEYCGVCMRLAENELIEIINEVKKIWPECRMVRGSPHHSPSNGGVEHVNCTIEEKLGVWMAETKSTNWSIGCRLMMWWYNTQKHRTIKDVPYPLLFGQMPRIGISDLQLAPGLLDTLATKAELNRVCDYIGTEPVLDAVVIDDKTEVIAAPEAATFAEAIAAIALEEIAADANVENNIVGETNAIYDNSMLDWKHCWITWTMKNSLQKNCTPIMTPSNRQEGKATRRMSSFQ